MNNYMDERLSEAKTIAERMLNGRIFSFAELKPSDLDDGLAVVYAIFHRDTTPQPLHWTPMRLYLRPCGRSPRITWNSCFSL